MQGSQTSKSGTYWRHHLLSWEASAYYADRASEPSLWDRLSTLFRGDAMYVRMNAALESLRPYLEGKRVLDVGCASGRLAFQLLDHGAASVHGVDVSPEAVQMANARAAEAGVDARFEVTDVVQPGRPLPECDIVTALGVIEYFDRRDLLAFLANLRSEYFFLDFPDSSRRREFPTWPLRQIYIRVHRLPGVHLYTPDEFRALAEPLGFTDIRVVERMGFFYITNLPLTPPS